MILFELHIIENNSGICIFFLEKIGDYNERYYRGGMIYYNKSIRSMKRLYMMH